MNTSILKQKPIRKQKGILFFNETVRRKSVGRFPLVIFLMLVTAYSSHVYAQKKQGKDQGKVSKQRKTTDINSINLPSKVPITIYEGGQGLQPMDNDQIVYDKSQDIYWLADANLAGDPKMRQ